MRVRLTVNVSDAERYIIAQYFNRYERDSTPRPRSRATRAQTASFTRAALFLALKDHRDAMRGRSAKVVERLMTGRIRAVQHVLIPARERNGNLFE